tara:strand:+ start:426 stop:1079 length:654 start_codon:yes stop_codon:yes gene_type:complete
MATTSATDLKKYFETGDKPTSTQFAELIDGNLNLNDGGTVVGATTISGVTKLTGNTGLTPGSGFGDAALYKSWISNEGTVTITNILIDLTGIRSTAGGDIIGDDGEANAHIGQYTTALCGTFFAASIQCLELPAGGNPDINLCSADEATLAEDSAIASAGTNPITIINSGNHAAGSAVWGTTAPNSSGQYLYLVAGATTDADYTTGVLHIKLYGTTA